MSSSSIAVALMRTSVTLAPGKRARSRPRRVLPRIDEPRFPCRFFRPRPASVRPLRLRGHPPGDAFHSLSFIFSSLTIVGGHCDSSRISSRPGSIFTRCTNWRSWARSTGARFLVQRSAISSSVSTRTPGLVLLLDLGFAAFHHLRQRVTSRHALQMRNGLAHRRARSAVWRCLRNGLHPHRHRGPATATIRTGRRRSAICSAARHSTSRAGRRAASSGEGRCAACASRISTISAHPPVATRPLLPECP